MADALDTRGATGSIKAVDLTENSFNKMIAAKMIKRGDRGLAIQLKNIHVEEGFNVRIPGPDLDAHVQAIADHLMAGGTVPQLEVQAKPGGGVVLTDGHCRHGGYTIADASGTGELWVDIVAFKGDRAARLARIHTSNEGKKLSGLELCNLYKQMRAEGMTFEQIGKAVNKTKQYVDQILQLEKADDETRDMIAKGEVSATLASTTIRQHGEQAGKALAEALVEAKRQGKTKVTAATIKPPTASRSLLDDLFNTVKGLNTKVTKDEAADIEVYLSGDKNRPRKSDFVKVPLEAFARMSSVLAEIERTIGLKNMKNLAQLAEASQIDMEEA